MDNSDTKPDFSGQNPPGSTQPKRVFQYTVNNQLKPPFFNESVDFQIKDEQLPLIRYMERSVDEHHDQFSGFQVTYFKSPLGYFVNSMNGRDAVYKEDKIYWQILNKGVPLQVGVSTFVPQNGDRIMFNLKVDTCPKRPESPESPE